MQINETYSACIAPFYPKHCRFTELFLWTEYKSLASVP